MPESSHALNPPEVAIDADLRWVLLAAFCLSAPADLGQPASADRAARLVHDFGLVGQVTSRRSRQQLLLSLSSAQVDSLARVATQWTMRGLAAAQVTAAVCEVATHARIEIALLKQAALRSMGLVTPAQRHASDVDLLLRPSDVARFSEALQRNGFSLEREKEHSHGVVVLRSTDRVGVELHTSIVGIALEPGEPDIGLDTLLQRQLATPHSPNSGFVWLPPLSILGVHLVWQGWGLFHYAPHAPEHKSPFRVLADLQYLGVHSNPTLAGQIRRLLPSSVPLVEYDGLVELVAELAHGQCEPNSNAARWVLNHVLATKLDPHYRDSLYLARQSEALRSEGLTGWVQRQFHRAFLPSAAELDLAVRSGRAANRSMARLQIPWQLAKRSWRGLRASLRRSRD